MMYRHHCGSTAATVLVVIMASSSAAAQAQDARKQFDVPAGPAVETINVFARQAGVNVLASEEILSARRTNAVKGQYPLAEALRLLLSGTGLDHKTTGSGAVFIVAQPQPQPQPAPVDALPSVADKIRQFVIVGTRASQQSGIERKKDAATVMDSIVAEDVGILPDRNVGEAISRMAGVALDRGDFGEGVSVAVRGNGPELTRIELDGQGVQAAGGTDMFGGGGGRGVEMRQLSADLIKSVDVVKAPTADMTEGSLGGSIRIQTRSGLDFKKPFVSVRMAASHGSLNKIWEPDANLLLANRFLDGRLAVLLNASSTVLANEAHSVQVSNAARAGYFRLADFDNSPDKTFTFQPATMNAADTNTTTPLLRSPLLAGGFFNAATPLDVLTKSAAARTKADCYAAFPQLTAEQTNAIVAGARGPAVTQRTNELITCLNQWNDYTPSNLRSFVKREFDKRQSLDLRLDFKVNSRLTTHAKVSYNRRYDDMHQLTYTQGNVKVNPSATANVVTPGYVGLPYVDNLAANTRTPLPGSGYYAYDTPAVASNTYLRNSVADIVPGSIVADASHHLTQFTITDAGAVTDQVHEYAKTTAKYAQAGFAYKDGPLTVDFFAGDARSDFERVQKRLAFANSYGLATLTLLPNGLWRYSVPAGSGFDQASPAQYAVAYPATPTAAIPASATSTRALPAYTAAQQPLLTQQPGTYYIPRVMQSEERTAKLDLAWRAPEDLPFLTRVKTGFNLRDTIHDVWDPNNGNKDGYTVKAAIGSYGQPGYVAPVFLPSPIIKSTFVGCQDTPGSLAAGGHACQYGFLPGADPRRALDGTTTMTVQQFQNLVAQTLQGQATPTQFFSGASGRPSGLLDNWTALDVDKAFAIVGTPNMNLDCVKSCTASDGNVYQQPYQHLVERTEAAYLMGDFKVDALPFGWELDGNVGYRYVRNRVHGTGMMTFTAITPVAGVYDPQRPTAAGGTVTSSISQPVSIASTTHDFLPSHHLVLWMVPDKLVARYSWGKAVARPPISYLLPAGTCTYDATLADRDPASVQTCSGTLGNPGLQAQTNVNQDVAVEWYPNKDTMFTVAGFRQAGSIGPAISRGVSGVPLAGGGGLADPTTGVALASVPFTYSLWQNGAATTRKGVEFSTKTAFTFLPWLLRYTGFDANYTRMRSATSSENVADLLTGEPLPPVRESKYAYNWTLWYDDGRLSARVAVQAVASYFNCIAACGVGDLNDYPAAGVTSAMVRFPYNPGSPNFKDATRFIDAKLSFKWRPAIEFFIEGRNLGNATTSNSQGTFAPFADGTPNLLDYAYAGRRIMVGVVYRNL